VVSSLHFTQSVWLFVSLETIINTDYFFVDNSFKCLVFIVEKEYVNRNEELNLQIRIIIYVTHSLQT